MSHRFDRTQRLQFEIYMGLVRQITKIIMKHAHMYGFNALTILFKTYTNRRSLI